MPARSPNRLQGRCAGFERLAVTVSVAAVCFAVVPFSVSMRLAIDNILVQRQFAPTLGTETTFAIARAALRLAWALNTVGFLLFSLALAVLTGRRALSARFVLVAAVSGCLVAIPVFLFQPFRVWVWLTLGPIGAVLSAALDSLLTKLGARRRSLVSEARVKY